MNNFLNILRKIKRTPKLQLDNAIDSTKDALTQKENLIITAANSDYFKFFSVFIKSLRKNASYKGKIVVCNYAAAKFKSNQDFDLSFKEDEIKFLKEYDVEVISFRDLLAKNGISFEEINAINTEHHSHPFKFIYGTLISKEYLYKADNIILIDADSYFQKPIEVVFAQIKEGNIYGTREYRQPRDDMWYQDAVFYSDFSRLSDSHYFKSKIMKSKIVGGNFFVGKAKDFHCFMILSWLLSSNSFIKFHSDLPLVSILANYLNHPIKIIEHKYICSLSGTGDKCRFDSDRKIFTFGKNIPPVIHFNGLVGRKIFEENGQFL